MNPNKPLRLFSQLAEEGADSDRVQFLKALAYSNSGNINQAKADAARALELNPKNLEARLLLADLYYRERNYDNAEKESREILNLNPSSLQALLILGNSVLHQKKYDESRRKFDVGHSPGSQQSRGILSYGAVEFGRRINRILPSNICRNRSSTILITWRRSPILFLHTRWRKIWPPRSVPVTHSFQS